MTAAGSGPASKSGGGQGLMKSKNSKPEEIRSSNIQAAKALSDAIRTSLGPRGMDKMIQDAKGEVTITNDGATILNEMKVVHPAARMLVELSKAQDIEAGDGTTSVCVLAGSLLDAADKLLKKGIHPTSISESFQRAAAKSVEILTSMSSPVDLSDRESLLKASNTSLNSKVVSQNSAELSPIAVDAVLKIIDPSKENNVNLKDIKIIKKIGGTVDDTELVDGMVFEQKAANVNGPKKIEKAKIGFIQFCVSPPKTDMDNQVVVSDYAAMDRVLREERAYLLNIVKQIKKAGCNVLLIQKSILRDALSDLATHFFDKMKIMVVKDIEREDVEFLCKTIGCRPIASLDHFTAENLASAELVEEVQTGSSKCVKITGMATPGKTCSIVIRGSNKLMLEEADRSIHDALCVIRCLVKKRFLIAGGGAPETEVSRELAGGATGALWAPYVDEKNAPMLWQHAKQGVAQVVKELVQGSLEEGERHGFQPGPETAKQEMLLAEDVWEMMQHKRNERNREKRSAEFAPSRSQVEKEAAEELANQDERVAQKLNNLHKVLMREVENRSRRQRNNSRRSTAFSSSMQSDVQAALAEIEQKKQTSSSSGGIIKNRRKTVTGVPRTEMTRLRTLGPRFSLSASDVTDVRESKRPEPFVQRKRVRAVSEGAPSLPMTEPQSTTLEPEVTTPQTVQSKVRKDTLEVPLAQDDNLD